jgi:tetratricopeptide (TPR) repeat protein
MGLPRNEGRLRRLRRPEAARLALGERTEALAAAREGIERGRDAGPRYSDASAQIALAQILLSADGDLPRAEIEAALDRTEELVASVEGRSLSPRILELRGRLAAALGDTPAADRALRHALAIYRTIGATGHAHRLERDIAGGRLERAQRTEDGRWALFA